MGDILTRSNCGEDYPMFPFLFFFLVVLVGQNPIASQVRASEMHWNQWRGPQRTGQVASEPWPDKLSDDALVLRWSQSLGASYSSPVMDGQRVYTTQSLDDQTEEALALDLMTGEVTWKSSWAGGMKVPFYARANGSWIRSTPLLHDGYLYVLGMQETLVCLRAMDGTVVWQRHLPEMLKTQESDFGGVSSPLFHDGGIVLQAGGGVVKLSASSGELDWFFKASDGEDNESPFSSPMLFELHGVPQLIVLERNRLCGLNPQNGQRLWSVQVPAFRGMNILTPTQVGSGLLTATYGGKTHLFEPSQSEDGNWQVNQKWIQNFQGYMSSPLVVGSHAYLHGRSGRMVCLDTQAGQVLWTSSESFGKYCSQVTNGERMLCLSHDGNLRLLKINPEHCQIMDETRVSQEETWAHLAVAGHSLILRSLHSLCIFDWKSQGVQ